MFSKVCTFLISRCNSVREIARDTLIQIIITLGPQYLSALMDAATPILQRGYQVHVYIYTVHAILAKLGELGLLKPGSLDAVVYQLVEVLNILFFITSRRVCKILFLPSCVKKNSTVIRLTKKKLPKSSTN